MPSPSKPSGSQTPRGGRTPRRETGNRTPRREAGSRTPRREAGSRTPRRQDGSQTPSGDSVQGTPTRRNQATPAKSVVSDTASTPLRWGAAREAGGNEIPASPAATSPGTGKILEFPQ